MKFGLSLFLAALAVAEPVEWALNKRFDFSNQTNSSAGVITLSPIPAASSVPVGPGSPAGPAGAPAAPAGAPAAPAGAPAPAGSSYGIYKLPDAIKPKVFIILMFDYEANAWLSRLPFTQNITVPGFLPLFPWAHCTEDGETCLLITGEGDENAGPTIMALTLLSLFDLSETYFLVTGIAGGDWRQVTLGLATFAEYAVEVGLQYEVSPIEAPDSYNWTTGYFSYHTEDPDAYPGDFYGTEIFKINSNLRDRAFDLALKAELAVGTKANIEFRALYEEGSAATKPPGVVKCDSLTSDTYWFGTILSDYFYTLGGIYTNNTGTFCSTSQEDNATLESLMRAAKFGLVDFARIVILRTILDFSAPPPLYQNDLVNFFNNVSQGGSHVAVDNIYYAGYPFVKDVLENWDSLYAVGAYGTDEYLGDVFGTLGGTPSFGPGPKKMPVA